MISLKDATPMRDLMHNLMPDSGASDEYRRGIIVGAATALVATGARLSGALGVLVLCTKVGNLPNLANLAPESWRGEIEEKVRIRQQM